MSLHRVKELLAPEDMLPWISDRTLLLMMLAVAASAQISATIFVVQSLLDGTYQASAGLAAVLASGCLVILAFRKWLGSRRTLVLFLGQLWLALTFVQSYRGLTPSTTFASVALLLMCSAVYSYRGLLVGMCAVVLSLVISVSAAMSGSLVPWSDTLWDVQRPVVWLRYVVLFVGMVAAIALGQAAMMRRLIAAERAAREMLERERIEHARVEAMREALERSRRLEALAQFAGGLAHDFNNNLAVIQGSVDLLALDAQLPPRAQRLISQVAAAAQTGAETVRSLLALGRSGVVPAQFVPMTALRRWCEGGLRGVFPEGVRLVLGDAPEAGVSAPPGRLEQALLNLATNARDAMGASGTFTVTFGERYVGDPPVGFRALAGSYMVISCSDTGCGMDDATQRKVFEPFFTTKAAGKGTGLGLATIHRLVLDAGGFLELESQLGVGTTIRLLLPRCEGPAHA